MNGQQTATPTSPMARRGASPARPAAHLLVRETGRLVDRLPEARGAGPRTSYPAYDAMRGALEACPPPPEEFRTRDEPEGP